MTPSEPLELARKLREIGISESYASLIANGRRKPSDRMAIRIWREAGIKLGPIEAASDEEIEVLAKVRGLQ
jgi:hypothetical protein